MNNPVNIKNKTINDFLHYLFSDFFVKGFLFITLPLLSRIMSPSEYGKLSLVNSSISILFVFLSFNLQNAVSNRYMRDLNGFGSYLFSNLLLLIPLQVLVVSFSPFFLSYLSPLFGVTNKDLFFIFLICSLLSIFYIYTSYLQAAKLSREFSYLNICSKVAEIVVLFLFALYMTEDQYLSKIYAQLIITIVLLIYIAPRIYMLLVFDFNPSYIKDALLFSIPLVPHVLANSLLSQVDRFLINEKMGVASSGVYSFSYNLAMAIVVVIMAWNSSWQPRLYKLLKDDNNTKVSTICKSSSVIMIFFSSIAILFSQEMVVLFASPDYYESIRIIPIIIIGNALIHIYLTYANFVFYEKKTIYISLATGIALAANIGLNLLFIPKYGIEGAAWATVIAYILLCLAHYMISTYVLKLNFLSFNLFVYYFLSLMACYFFCNALINVKSYVIILAIKVFASLFLVLILLKFRKKLELS